MNHSDVNIAYQHEQNCHDLIILSFPARLYASQGGSCCVEPIAVLHLRVDGCTSQVNCTHSYNDWFWLCRSNGPGRTVFLLLIDFVLVFSSR